MNFKCLDRGFCSLGKIALELFRAVYVLMLRTNPDKATNMLIFSKAVLKQMHYLRKQKNSCSEECLKCHAVQWVSEQVLGTASFLSGLMQE